MLTAPAKKQITKKKTTEKKQISTGRIYALTIAFNNTWFAATDTKGDGFDGSAGASGFKGAYKGYPFCSNAAVESVSKKAKEFGVTALEVYIKGPGPVGILPSRLQGRRYEHTNDRWCGPWCCGPREWRRNYVNSSNRFPKRKVDGALKVVCPFPKNPVHWKRKVAVRTGFVL